MNVFLYNKGETYATYDQEYVDNLNKEIEELNNIIDKQDRDITTLTKDKIKLKNIINELEKDIDLELYKTRANNDYNNGLFNAFRYIKDKLKELKEGK